MDLTIKLCSRLVKFLEHPNPLAYFTTAMNWARADRARAFTREQTRAIQPQELEQMAEPLAQSDTWDDLASEVPSLVEQSDLTPRERAIMLLTNDGVRREVIMARFRMKTLNQYEQAKSRAIKKLRVLLRRRRASDE